MLNLTLPSGISAGLLAQLRRGPGKRSGKQPNTAWALVLSDGGRIDFDSIISCDIDSSNSIMQNPTEMGGFVMYNKAVGPTRVTVEAAVTGSPERRAQLTKILLDLSGSTDLLTLITPEYEFTNLNCESTKYSRTADDGANAIYFSLSLVEVRQVTAQYTNARVGRKKSKGKKNGNESALSGLFSRF